MSEHNVNIDEVAALSESDIEALTADERSALSSILLDSAIFQMREINSDTQLFIIDCEDFYRVAQFRDAEFVQYVRTDCLLLEDAIAYMTSVICSDIAYAQINVCVAAMSDESERYRVAIK